MRGFGKEFLKQSLDILARQTFKDFDVVISDHSKDDVIKELCDTYNDSLDIKYFKHIGMTGNSANTNNAIKHATGKLIKILFQDDFLYSERSLEEIVSAFDMEKDNWLVTACEHTADGVNFYRPFYPKYNQKIHLEKNTISSPSVLTIRNEDPLLFDENLKWLMDCDYYKRCYDRYGEPKILNTINVVNRLGIHQITHQDKKQTGQINDAVKKQEYQYVLKKFNENKLFWNTEYIIKEFLKKTLPWLKRS